MIRYRCYDKNTYFYGDIEGFLHIGNKLIRIYYIDKEEGLCFDEVSEEQVILLPYTGMHNGLGEEFCLGDVLGTNDAWPLKVDYICGSFVVWSSDPNNNGFEYMHDCVYLEYYKVIGNI